MRFSCARSRIIAGIVLVGATSFATMGGPAAAATFTVTNVLASGAGSLSQAILDAEASAGADTITFDPSTNGLTIPTGANINNHSVTIIGNGVGVTILSGEINVNAGSGGSAAATVSGMTASSINVNSGSNSSTTTTASFTDVVVSAGGVNVNSGSGSITTASFTNVVVSAGGVNINSGFGGSSTTVSFTTSSVMGGLSANASASTTNVTIDSSTIQGGEGQDVLSANDSGTTVVVRASTLTNGARGIRVSGSVVNVTNSTISNVVGNGIVVFSGTVTLQNVTVADTGDDSLNISGESTTVTVGNSLFGGSVGDACTLTQPTSLGGNLADDATCGFTATGDQQNVILLLGALADNGGPTLTRLPGVGSPAIDGGVAAGCPIADQRGVARPQDGNGDSTVVCDSGAVEVAALPAVTTTTAPAVTTTMPAVTTTPAAAVPVTTAVPIPAVLPATGAGTSISTLAIISLALGAGLVVIAMRRRPTA